MDFTAKSKSASGITINLKYIKKSGMNAGLAIKPATDWKEVIPYLPLCDMVLVMTCLLYTSCTLRLSAVIKFI